MKLPWEDTEKGRFFHCSACGGWEKWKEGWRWYVSSSGRLTVTCSEGCRMIAERTYEMAR